MGSLVRKPFICRLSWSPNLQQTQNGCIALTFGECGYVQADKSNNWLQIVIPRRQQIGLPVWHGLVPASRKYLEIGSVDYGNVTIDRQVSLQLNVSVRPDQITAPGLFGRTIKALCVAFSQQAVAIGLDPKFRGRLEDPNRLAQLAVQGASACGVLDVLDTKGFGADRLWRALTPLQTDDQSGGVYLQVLDFRPAKSMELRVGMTMDFAKRNLQHNKAFHEDMGSFYKAWRLLISAQQYIMAPLIRDIADIHDRYLLEQFLVLMLGSYRKYLLLKETKTALSSQSIEALANETDIQVNYSDALAARVLSDLASQTFDSSGWEPITRRTNSECSVGWNHSSPVFETTFYEPLIWTRADVPGMKAVFRRTALRRNNQTHLTLSQTRNNNNRKVQVHLGDAIPVGTLYYPSVEIMLDGTAHPCALANLIPETLAPLTDWNLALSVAVKVEWTDGITGKWMSKYLQIQSGANQHLMKLDHQHALDFTNYAQAMGLRWKLLRQSCPDDLVGWLKKWDCGLAVVKQVYFNHLEQRIELYDATKSSTAVSPRQIPRTALESKLVKLGATNINAFEAGSTCDFCAVQTMGSRNCELQNFRTCGVCFDIGIPCSTTRIKPPKLLEALSARPIDARSIQVVEVDNPEVQHSK